MTQLQQKMMVAVLQLFMVVQTQLLITTTLDANEDNGSCYYSCDEGQAQVDILVTTDTYSGSENSFTLYVDGSLLDYVDLSYDDQITTVTTTYCVDNGSDIEFVLD